MGHADDTDRHLLGRRRLFAGRNLATDTFHLFERFVSYGKQMPDGRAADKNYVWLSEWQLENINSHYLLPIDFDTYLQLKNQIAKALVPLLQIWLYATLQAGCFEKHYDDLCKILNIRQYPHLSRIKWLPTCFTVASQTARRSAYSREKRALALLQQRLGQEERMEWKALERNKPRLGPAFAWAS